MNKLQTENRCPLTFPFVEMIARWMRVRAKEKEEEGGEGDGEGLIYVEVR